MVHQCKQSKRLTYCARSYFLNGVMNLNWSSYRITHPVSVFEFCGVTLGRTPICASIFCRLDSVSNTVYKTQYHIPCPAKLSCVIRHWLSFTPSSVHLLFSIPLKRLDGAIFFSLGNVAEQLFSQGQVPGRLCFSTNKSRTCTLEVTKCEFKIVGWTS